MVTAFHAFWNGLEPSQISILGFTAPGKSFRLKGLESTGVRCVLSHILTEGKHNDCDKNQIHVHHLHHWFAHYYQDQALWLSQCLWHSFAHEGNEWVLVNHHHRHCLNFVKWRDKFFWKPSSARMS